MYIIKVSDLILIFFCDPIILEWTGSTLNLFLQCTASLPIMDVPIPKFLPMPNPMPFLVEMPMRIQKKLSILADAD